MPVSCAELGVLEKYKQPTFDCRNLFSPTGATTNFHKYYLFLETYDMRNEL